MTAPTPPRRLLTFFAALLAAPLVCADTSRVDNALQALDDTAQDDHWQFTMTVIEGDETRAVSHDPTKAPYDQRNLLSVDGSAPSAERQKEFRKQEKKRVDERDPEASYSYLVDLETLAEVERNGDIVRYSFTPRLKDFEKADGKLGGALLLDTAAGAINRIEVFSTEEFSPAFSVSLQNYQLHFNFRDEQGYQVLDSMTSRAVGKAGFLKKFDSRVDITFSDYRRIAGQQIEERPALEHEFEGKTASESALP